MLFIEENLKSTQERKKKRWEEYEGWKKGTWSKKKGWQAQDKEKKWEENGNETLWKLEEEVSCGNKGSCGERKGEKRVKLMCGRVTWKRGGLWKKYYWNLS